MGERKSVEVRELMRPDLAAITGYTPIEPVEILGQRTELPPAKIIKLDGNENPYGCSPQVYRALADYPRYHIYPDPEQRVLKQALEEYTGMSRRHIVCGSGSDELIELILKLFLEAGDEVISCPPTFGMYPFLTEVCGGRLVSVPRNEDFTLDVAGVKKALTRKTKVIFVTSPNNPTGNLISRQEVLELLDMGRILVVDEAYFEFADASVADLVPAHPNLAVLRTFSKWAGLAGLRVGYGFFSPEIAACLMKIKQPYNINVAAQAAVLASLSDVDYLRHNVAMIIAERDRLFEKLGEIEWLHPYPSRGNFILNLVLRGNAGEIWGHLRQRGIFIRYFDNPVLVDCLRISVGRPEDTDTVVEALKALPVAAAGEEQTRRASGK